MNVYEIANGGERTWVSGITNIHALITYCQMSDCSLYDFSCTDEIVQIPESDWDNISVEMENETISVKMWMERNPNISEIIASTAYGI